MSKKNLAIETWTGEKWGMAKNGKRATAASAGAGAANKKKGGHAHITLTGLGRMASDHRKMAAFWREEMKTAATEFKFAMNCAARVHEECAKVLGAEAEILRGQP